MDREYGGQEMTIVSASRVVIEEKEGRGRTGLVLNHEFSGRLLSTL